MAGCGVRGGADAQHRVSCGAQGHKVVLRAGSSQRGARRAQAAGLRARAYANVQVNMAKSPSSRPRAERYVASAASLSRSTPTHMS